MMGIRQKILTVCVSLFLWGLTIVAINFTTVPWVDECGTVDTAVNMVFHNCWDSHVWHYSYNPLHINLLFLWLKVFGVSHLSVCALSATLGLVLCLVLQRILHQNGVLNSFVSNMLYSVMFWCGWQFSWILVNGRIDTLVAIFTTLVVNELYRKDFSALRVFTYSFLLMLSGVYSLPLVLMFGVFLVFLRSGPDRGQLIRKGFICALGIVLAFLLSCAYYVWHRQLFRFVNTFFSFNETLSGRVEVHKLGKLIECYMYDVQAVAVYVLTLCILLFRKGKSHHIWPFALMIGMIPLVAKMSGRYELYYSWLFYLPVLVLFLGLVTNRAKAWALVVLAVVNLGVFPFCLVKRSQHAKASIDESNLVESYVLANPMVFKSGESAVISSFSQYYPLARRGMRLYLHGSGSAGQVSPREKFERFLRTKTSGVLSEYLMEVFNKWEREYDDTITDGAIDINAAVKGLSL